MQEKAKKQKDYNKVNWDALFASKTIQETDGYLHKLWTIAVGQEGYIKQEWKDLEKSLWRPNG